MVEKGRVAVVHFIGRIAEGVEAGAVFDTTDVDIALAEGIYHDHRDYKPLVFPVGVGADIASAGECFGGRIGAQWWCRTSAIGSIPRSYSMANVNSRISVSRFSA